MNKDKFTLDKCSICGKYKALKNNVCNVCAEKIVLPKCFEDIFGEFKNEKR